MAALGAALAVVTVVDAVVDVEEGLVVDEVVVVVVAGAGMEEEHGVVTTKVPRQRSWVSVPSLHLIVFFPCFGNRSVGRLFESRFDTRQGKRGQCGGPPRRGPRVADK